MLRVAHFGTGFVGHFAPRAIPISALVAARPGVISTLELLPLVGRVLYRLEALPSRLAH
jgi:hypothetical protein